MRSTAQFALELGFASQFVKFDHGKITALLSPQSLLMRIALSIAVFCAVIISIGVQAKVPATGVHTPNTLPHQAAQLIVRYQAGADTSGIVDALSSVGGAQLIDAQEIQLLLIGIDDDANLPGALELARLEPSIVYAEPNYLQALDAVPNDIDFSLQWSKENRGINAPNGQGVIGADLNLPAAWDIRATAANVIIGIIDDSVETLHIDLLGNVMSSGKCFSSPGSSRPCSNGADDPNPSDANDFHGTLVAGTAGARGNNSIGIAGAAWEVNLLPLKVDLTTFAIAQAIDEATRQGAAIINMSFGGAVQSQAIDEAVGRAENAGILVIASAGNADSNNTWASHYPSDSNRQNVLSVAATNANDSISAFSQWGAESVHIAAPGELVRTTAANNQFAVVSGTSFAAPHVAGVAALIKAQTGAPNYKKIKANLLHGVSNGASTLGSITPGQNKNQIPGRVATGRLDAAKALQGTDQGVVMVKNVTIDDAVMGNDNGRLDPGETVKVVITLYNAWSDEASVNGTLSVKGDTALTVVDISPVLFGDIAQEETQSAAFTISLSSDWVGNHSFFMQLDLTSSTSINLAQRYFYLEVGSLENGVPVTQQIQRWNWDEFQAFHIDVPVGRTNLSVATSGTGDIDLLMFYQRPPEYLITLNAQQRGLDGFYYVEPNTKVSGTEGANESISMTNPLPGTYHFVVVNYDQMAKNYTLTATHTDASTDTVAFSQSNYVVSETQQGVQINVTRTGAIGEASVSYSTSSGSAQADLDYTDVSGTLTWASGETGDKVFSIPILNDSEIESSDTVLLSLSNISGALAGQPNSATLTIIDDDNAESVFEFSQLTYTTEEAAGQLLVAINRTGNTTSAASVTLSTDNQSAIAGDDFQQTSSVLSWGAGQNQQQTLSIPIIDDSLEENFETFVVVMTAPHGGAVATQNTATVTIVDDDIASTTGPTSNQSSGGGYFGLSDLLLILAVWGLRRRRL